MKCPNCKQQARICGVGPYLEMDCNRCKATSRIPRPALGSKEAPEVAELLRAQWHKDNGVPMQAELSQQWPRRPWNV